MRILVVYDSTHGNTAKIAQAIGQAIGCQARPVGEVDPTELSGHDLLIVGSPTHGGWFTPEIRALLEASPALEGRNVVAFDTRTRWSLFGYAAPRLARALQSKGGTLAAPPEGFIVLGIKGPLKEGELERAAGWAEALVR